MSDKSNSWAELVIVPLVIAAATLYLGHKASIAEQGIVEAIEKAKLEQIQAEEFHRLAAARSQATQYQSEYFVENWDQITRYSKQISDDCVSALASLADCKRIYFSVLARALPNQIDALTLLNFNYIVGESTLEVIENVNWVEEIDATIDLMDIDQLKTFLNSFEDCNNAMDKQKLIRAAEQFDEKSNPVRVLAFKELVKSTATALQFKTALDDNGVPIPDAFEMVSKDKCRDAALEALAQSGKTQT